VGEGRREGKVGRRRGGEEEEKRTGGEEARGGEEGLVRLTEERDVGLSADGRGDAARHGLRSGRWRSSSGGAS